MPERRTHSVTGYRKMKDPKELRNKKPPFWVRVENYEEGEIWEGWVIKVKKGKDYVDLEFGLHIEDGSIPRAGTGARTFHVYPDMKEVAGGLGMFSSKPRVYDVNVLPDKNGNTFTDVYFPTKSVNQPKISCIDAMFTDRGIKYYTD